MSPLPPSLAMGPSSQGINQSINLAPCACISQYDRALDQHYGDQSTSIELISPNFSSNVLGRTSKNRKCTTHSTVKIRTHDNPSKTNVPKCSQFDQRDATLYHDTPCSFDFRTPHRATQHTSNAHHFPRKLLLPKPANKQVLGHFGGHGVASEGGYRRRVG